ncbi:hypothetical protein QWJ26_11950 [Streptomyces sp. CSDS2]|uniref:hypothetical protein n=1 Tax=Streptomyces sp. CSDS2 TaxID=3055051 RepID=UPI0025B217F9|nr:hypothetical protein [Streptomyces sp. CSDS2]MDN3260514.1 hypothetical protein [Streptomyces sp. CSDS2]
MPFPAGTDRCPAGACETGHRAAAGGPEPSLCPACRDRVAADLAELPQLYRDIEYLLVPAVTDGVGRVSGSRNTGLVLDAEASATRAETTAVLACWAGLLAELVPEPAPERAVGPMAAFLLRHLDVLAVHPSAAELADEIGGLAARARRVVDRPVPGPAPLGPCPRPGCTERVRAGAGDAGSPGVVRCDDGHAWAAHEWLALRRMLGGTAAAPAGVRRTLPTPLAAQAAGVSQATIRKWASRGKLTRHGSSSRPEYDVDELAALAVR